VLTSGEHLNRIAPGTRGALTRRRKWCVWAGRTRRERIAHYRTATARSWTMARAYPGAAANDIGADNRQAAGDQTIATRLRPLELSMRAVRGNLNILSEARIHAPELISHRISVDPIDEELRPSLVSREVRR
jgi:hypothetical protein